MYTCTQYVLQLFFHCRTVSLDNKRHYRTGIYSLLVSIILALYHTHTLTMCSSYLSTVGQCQQTIKDTIELIFTVGVGNTYLPYTYLHTYCNMYTYTYYVLLLFFHCRTVSVDNKRHYRADIYSQCRCRKYHRDIHITYYNMYYLHCSQFQRDREDHTPTVVSV